MMKIYIFLTILLMIVSHALSSPVEKKDDIFICSCFVFNCGAGVLEFQTTLDSETVQDLFKKDYPFSGERIEVPKGAKIFGCLILSNNSEAMAFPLYYWKEGGSTYYSFQGLETGKAPALYVAEHERNMLLKNLQKELKDPKRWRNR